MDGDIFIYVVIIGFHVIANFLRNRITQRIDKVCLLISNTI